jgi:4-hydroxy-tetrahydrodipicolinate synthase
MLTPFAADGRIDWHALDVLTDWYLAGDSQGLFAACLSSEIFQLSDEERLAVVCRVMSRAGGRVPVITAGAFVSGGEKNTPAALAAAVARLADTGVAAVVILTNQLVAADASDDAWLTFVEDLLARIDGHIRLGLYECPVPHKRVLSARLTAWAAGTGRFDFLKDTCCDFAQIKAKLAALAGSPLRLYNAHTATLLPSLRAGAHGFSGIGANLIPHLYTWLCRQHRADPALAAELQVFLTATYPVVSLHYPVVAKAYLGLHGLPVLPVSRMNGHCVETGDLAALHALHNDVLVWEQRLGLVSPFAAAVASRR